MASWSPVGDWPLYWRSSTVRPWASSRLVIGVAPAGGSMSTRSGKWVVVVRHFSWPSTMSASALCRPIASYS
ncbi:hypothetical protein [Nonomuraea salmonea]|uniref:hypothetical protein n=1 Tax=Nonomuraea salmonea TaxID=46181 RepID=UPI003CD06D70